MMNWLQLLSAIGLGALLTKVLDIIWLQRSLRKTEKLKWLRDHKLRVYSKVATEMLSLGKNFKTREDAFSGYALAAEAILLTEDEKLSNDIEQFFTKLSNLYRESMKDDSDPTKKSEDHLEGAYKVVREESRRLVSELSKSIHK
jgi:hypothetical protein